MPTVPQISPDKVGECSLRENLTINWSIDRLIAYFDRKKREGGGDTPSIPSSPEIFRYY